MTERQGNPERARDLTSAEFRQRLKSGLGIGIGPFAAHIRAEPESLVHPLHGLYANYPLLPDDSVFSFHARLDLARAFPRVHRRMLRFSVDGQEPHEPMPAEQALPVLEWGINLVIAMRSHAFLMLHAAVVELDGGGMLLPAAPGYGKSTLCAGLSLRGWRLLSDEFGLLRPRTTDLIPVPRPVALKDASIDVIRDFDADAVLGPSTPNTRKGTVAHLRPPGDSVALAGEPAAARWIVFPRWEPGEPSRLTPISGAEAFMLLATNAFNYELLGEAGFDTVADVVAASRCFRFVYSDLEDAVEQLTALAREHNG
ncbi:MAG: HprK-related kinase A [Woeseiaceae bacterium]|nr:HprK-related kinase A [Woeseiaceae bacterium]